MWASLRLQGGSWVSIRHYGRRKEKINRLDWKQEFLSDRKRSLWADEDDDVESFVDRLENEVTRTYLDRWKTKIEMFVSNPLSTEILSTDSKDVKCFHALRYLANEKNIHCQLYSKNVVFSKIPLPFYRPDLDPGHPQRQVFLTPSVFKTVNALLKNIDRHKVPSKNEEVSAGTNATVLPVTSTSPADMYSSVTRMIGDARRSVWMFNKQRAWQDTHEGRNVLNFRQKLPAFKHRAAFLESLRSSQVLIISGETGCGKTTQLPQYILESEIDAGCGSACNVICTQPRRISASAVAHRVATERGESLGESVGYQVRFEAVRSRNTNLLFCTTGILLRRLMHDPVLTGVTHVVVDEIHERGLNEDFLLIVLKDVIRRRPDLKLILMSATLDAVMFQNYFEGSKLLQIPGFAHPVKLHFLEDVLHLTGYKLDPESELWTYLKLPATSEVSDSNRIPSLTLDDYTSKSDFELIEHVLCHICAHGEEGAVLVFLTGWEDISSLRRQLRKHRVLGNTTRVQLVGCHGSMSAEEQKHIFERPPPDVRKIILSTNLAETSITIDDVVYVVDIGKAKEKRYDILSSTTSLTPKWISKASARQRRGRAGRLKPGVCYYLYPQSLYEAFEEHNEPEIHRTALHTVGLHIKGLKLGGIAEFMAKAIQPPDPENVHTAVEFLKIIGAIDENEELTVLGKHLSMLPVEPQIGKMLIMGCVFQCLDPILTIAAALSSRDPFVIPVERREDSNFSKFKFSASEMSDHVALVRAYNDWEVCMSQNTGAEFCANNFLSMPAMVGMSHMRKQFLNLLRDAGFLDMSMSNCETYASDPLIVRSVICAGLFPGVAAAVSTPRGIVHRTIDGAEVRIHPQSVNARPEETGFPWLLYLEKIRTSNVYIRESTGVSDSILLLFGGPLMSVGHPGHVYMCGKALEFFMNKAVVNTFRSLRDKLDELIKSKLENPQLDIYQDGANVMKAVLAMIRGDVDGGRFIFQRPTDVGTFEGRVGDRGAKLKFQALMLYEGIRRRPIFSVRKNNANMFVAKVLFRGLTFVGEPDEHKKQAERNVCFEASQWLLDPANAERKKMWLWGSVPVPPLRIKNNRAYIKRLHPLAPPQKWYPKLDDIPALPPSVWRPRA